jgi:citrate synthase
LEIEKTLTIKGIYMGILKERFASKFETVSTEIKEIIKEHGSKKIGEVSLSQVYQGMRGITGLVTETSLLDSQEGIRFRGYTIPELQEKLPKAPNGTEPLPEGLLYLMLIGELPTAEDVQHVTNVLQRRSHVPSHVFASIEALPVSAHPMTQFVVAIMALQTESEFAKKYAKGMAKKDYWEATFDDYWPACPGLRHIFIEENIKTEIIYNPTACWIGRVILPTCLALVINLSVTLCGFI